MPRSFKDAWLGTLKESIDGIIEYSHRKSEADIWEHPTPAETLKRFRIASRLTNERIAEGTKISLKTLERLITRDRMGMRLGNATKLLAFMKESMRMQSKAGSVASSEAEYFLTLQEVDLYWRKKP